MLYAFLYGILFAYICVWSFALLGLVFFQAYAVFLGNMIPPSSGLKLVDYKCDEMLSGRMIRPGRQCADMHFMSTRTGKETVSEVCVL
jgi:hypothetical protein